MKPVDWSDYSQVYDLMTEVNPAYQELLSYFEKFLSDSGLKEGDCFADFGAGTGNFSIAAAQKIRGLEVLHVESDEGMNARANSKVARGDLVRVIMDDIEKTPIKERSLDGASVVHALYTLSHPREFLVRLARGMRPGGRVFLCDLGRVLNLTDWWQYLLRDSLARRGFLATAGVMIRGRSITVQNRKIAREQRAGRYWTHTHEEFVAAVRQAGLRVISHREVYRGYSDLVIAEREEVS
jgi:ubiquinone/menaquinone biosynthesis C-methylase UbiE